MKGEKLPNYIIAILALAGAAVVLSCFTFIIVLVSIDILKQRFCTFKQIPLGLVLLTITHILENNLWHLPWRPYVCNLYQIRYALTSLVTAHHIRQGVCVLHVGV